MIVDPQTHLPPKYALTVERRVGWGGAASKRVKQAESEERFESKRSGSEAEATTAL